MELLSYPLDSKLGAIEKLVAQLHQPHALFVANHGGIQGEVAAFQILDRTSEHFEGLLEARRRFFLSHDSCSLRSSGCQDFPKQTSARQPNSQPITPVDLS